MRIRRDVTVLLAVACAGAAAPAWAQARSGTSMPQAVMTASPEDSVTDPWAGTAAAAKSSAKPSAAIPAVPTSPASSTSQDVYGAYVPYVAPGTSGASSLPASATTGFNPDAAIAGDTIRRPMASAKSNDDADARIVTSVAWPANEIPEGALVKVRLRESISTLTTRAGSAFTADLSDPVQKDGVVYLPVGSVLQGRVTMVQSGSKIRGGAAIHLETRTVTLPDGTQYPLHARVVDTSSWDNTKVNSEGTISKKDPRGRQLATLGLASGGGAAAGAMVAGVPGALVGAGIGAGVSTVVWLKQDRQAVLPKDLGLVLSLTAPISVAPARADLATKPTTHGE